MHTHNMYIEKSEDLRSGRPVQYIEWLKIPPSAEIFKQYMGAMNRVVVLARQATQPGGIGSLDSFLGLLKSLKIRAQYKLIEEAKK